jgi:imidazolonepropionase-like amidohydrolase
LQRREADVTEHPLIRAVFGVLAALAASSAVARDVVIHAGTLIDGVSEAPRRQISILVHDDRIVGVEPGFKAPPGAEVIDLSSATVLPGFIDCHVHMSGKLPSRTNATEDWLTHSALDRAFDGALFTRQMLQQGFTSARDVGGGDETVAVRNAINAGRISGPRLWVSLEALGPTAGHGDPKSGLDPGLSHVSWGNGISSRSCRRAALPPPAMIRASNS